MKRIQKGFTLIELMIVVAIIGILAAVAIPAYQDYIVKAKLSKVQSTIDPVKLALAMYYQENGTFPQGSADTGTAIATGDLWSSIGLNSLPILPAEVTKLKVDGSNKTDVGLTLTLDHIKAGTIDTKTVGIIGVAGGTAITWSCYQAGAAASHAATSVTDPIALKYFGGDTNPGCVN